MFLGTGVTSSVTQAAGAPTGGTRASPKTLVVLVKTKDSTPAAIGLFQQIERAGDVGVDEVLPAMGGDMRLVQSGRLEDRLDAAQTTPHARAVGYRADVSRKRRVKDVEADDLVFQVLQGADQGLAEMTGTSCNQDSHAQPNLLSVGTNSTLTYARSAMKSQRAKARSGRGHFRCGRFATTANSHRVFRENSTPNGV